VFKAGSKVDGVFKDNPHTAWESYQNTMATSQYKTIMSGDLYPKRSQMFDKTKTWEQELNDWEHTSSKKQIMDRNKSFLNFKETLY
jgi:hypothetical protein